jgi:hypothetical protein
MRNRSWRARGASLRRRCLPQPRWHAGCGRVRTAEVMAWIYLLGLGSAGLMRRRHGNWPQAWSLDTTLRVHFVKFNHDIEAVREGFKPQPDPLVIIVRSPCAADSCWWKSAQL